MTDWRNAPPRGDDEYATSPNLWRPLSRAVGGFDLDPAAGCEPEQIATERFTAADNGLSKRWHGKVWLNPPFSEKTQWYRKAVNEYSAGHVDRIVSVVPIDASTVWFQRMIGTAGVLGMLEGRDWYVNNPGAGGSPSFNTGIAIWNANSTLVDQLADMGIVAHMDTNKRRQTLEEAVA